MALCLFSSQDVCLRINARLKKSQEHAARHSPGIGYGGCRIPIRIGAHFS
jgi:hypothetical protein